MKKRSKRGAEILFFRILSGKEFALGPGVQILVYLGGIFPKIPFEKGTINFFLYAKEKSCKKEVRDLTQVDRLLTRAPDKVRQLMSAFPHGWLTGDFILPRKNFGVRVVRLRDTRLSHLGILSPKCGKRG